MRRLLAALHRSDPEAWEIWGGILLAWYGSWLVMPWQTWATVTSDGCCEVGGFDLVARVWSTELVQGVAFIVVGLASIAGGAFQWRLRMRAVTASVGVVLWVITLLSFALFRWESTATPMYGISAFAQLWLLYRFHIEGAVRQRLSGEHHAHG